MASHGYFFFNQKAAMTVELNSDNLAIHKNNISR